jgi:hypothetical protein
MTGSRTAQLAMAAAFALGIAGCHDPYQHEPAQKSSPTATPAPGDAERPGPRAPTLRTAPETPAGGARAAARAFASGWVNWDWRTLPARQRALGRLAKGRLAAELRANAKASAADASLPRDRPSSRGTVVAIDLHQRGHDAAAVIVIREQTYTGGHADLGGQRHRVYRAALAHSAAGWGVSAWTPLP